MKPVVTIKKANENNFFAVCSLLAEEHLPTADLNPLLENFFVIIDDNGITGIIGMDKYGEYGLLRSAIVKKEYRNKGIATVLVNKLIEHAKQQQVSSLYLITNTAEKYFQHRGFIKITRDEVPVAVLQSLEFNGLCPASSTIMQRRL